MCDLEAGEVVFIPVIRERRAVAERVKFLRVARSVIPLVRKRLPFYVVLNDKGTEQALPCKYVYKSASDAYFAAQEMVG